MDDGARKDIDDEHTCEKAYISWEQLGNIMRMTLPVQQSI